MRRCRRSVFNPGRPAEVRGSASASSSGRWTLFNNEFVRGQLDDGQTSQLSKGNRQDAIAAYQEEVTLIENQRDQINQKINDARSELLNIESVALVRDEQSIIAPMVAKAMS